MRIISKVKKIIIWIYNVLFNYLIRRGEIKNINKKEDLYKRVILTDSQNKEIQDFYLKYYGKKIDTRWHRLYQSYTGIFDKRYFPEILFSTKLERLLSDRTIARQMTDKSMVELLYSGIDGLYIPNTTVLCCSGIYYDGNRNIITKDKALKILANCGLKVFKKTIDSSSGRGVMVVNLKKSYDLKNEMSLDDLLLSFGNNFIVQEVIKNCKEISNIYSKSLNTFRVMTYVVGGKLYHVPIALRIGRNGNEVDNIHAGGMFVGVSDDGFLMDKAFTEYQDVFLKHPDSGVVFKGYKLSNIDKMINLAYKCHGRTPHLGLISWDFAIDNKNRIVLVEVNLNGQSIWFPQMANGKSAFGENTEYMLKLISKRRNKHEKY